MHSIFQNNEYLPIQMLLYIFNVFTMIVATMLMLERKYSVKKTLLLAILIIYISLFPKHFDNMPEWTTQILLIATPICVIILFKDELHIKIISSVISLLIIMGADYFAYFSTVILLGNIENYKNQNETYLISIVSLLLFAIIYVLLWNKFYKKSISIFFRNNLALFFALIFIQLIYIFFSITEYYTLQNYLPANFNNTKRSFVFVCILLFVITDIIVLFFTKSSSMYHKIETERKMLKYQNKLQVEYYEQIIKNFDQTAKLRHDINNIVQVINIQLNENSVESRKKAKKLANEINCIMDNTKVHKFCDNRIIDTVLFDKSNLAKKHSIKVIDDIIINENINIDDFDLCRIFINLLDNAINATQSYNGEQEKIIYISCKENNESIYIKCINPSSSNKKATVNNSSMHGYGLKIIEDITEKYNGTFTTKTFDNTFTALIALEK